jgi:hypothetical protein
MAKRTNTLRGLKTQRDQAQGNPDFLGRPIQARSRAARLSRGRQLGICAAIPVCGRAVTGRSTARLEERRFALQRSLALAAQLPGREIVLEKQASK